MKLVYCRECKIECGKRLCADCKAAKNERGTLPETLEWCRLKAGVDKYTLDVAASQELHVCDAYYTKADDSLTRPWNGNVWCNPPFDNLEAFVNKAWYEWYSGRCDSISMLIPANRTEQPFWQYAVEGQYKNCEYFDIHFLPGRTKFKGFSGSPLFACVLLVWKRP